VEQAKIINSLPLTPDEIAKKLNIDIKKVDAAFQELFEKGILFPGKSGWHLSRSWGAARDAVGSLNPKYATTDLFDLLYLQDNATRASRVPARKEALDKGEKVKYGMRVVPRWKAIKDIPGILPCEDIRQIFKGMDPIALVNCPCKMILTDRDCKDTIPIQTCITCQRSGDYNLKRGAGKKLTYKEVMDLFDSLDKYQLVHLTGNSNAPPTLVCNCHNDCCGVFLTTSMLHKALGKDQNGFQKSRFIATVDPAKCKGCRTCVDKRCPVGAAKMKKYPEFKDERSTTDEDDCIGCGLCVITCPNNARKLKMVRPPSWIPEKEAAVTE
jgi:ferredoxin